MKGTGILLAASLLACSAFGTPVKQRSAFAVKDAHHVPRRWSQVGYPDADHKIALRIGLKQGSFSELERHLCKPLDSPVAGRNLAEVNYFPLTIC